MHIPVLIGWHYIMHFGHLIACTYDMVKCIVLT